MNKEKKINIQSINKISDQKNHLKQNNNTVEKKKKQSKKSAQVKHQKQKHQLAVSPDKIPKSTNRANSKQQSTSIITQSQPNNQSNPKTSIKNTTKTASVTKQPPSQKSLLPLEPLPLPETLISKTNTSPKKPQTNIIIPPKSQPIIQKSQKKLSTNPPIKQQPNKLKHLDNITPKQQPLNNKNTTSKNQTSTTTTNNTTSTNSNKSPDKNINTHVNQNPIKQKITKLSSSTTNPSSLKLSTPEINNNNKKNQKDNVIKKNLNQVPKQNSKIESNQNNKPLEEKGKSPITNHNDIRDVKKQVLHQLPVSPASKTNQSGTLATTNTTVHTNNNTNNHKNNAKVNSMIVNETHNNSKVKSLSNQKQRSKQKPNPQSPLKKSKNSITQPLTPIQTVQQQPLQQQQPKIPAGYTQQQYKRLKFIKKMRYLNQKNSLHRLQSIQHQQHLRQQRIQQQLQHQQHIKSLQKQSKLHRIQQRIQKINQRKHSRKLQISQRNKQYQQKKQQYTLQHKLINSWIQKQIQINKQKQYKLKEKIDKLKPGNHKEQILNHQELIKSYKELHSSRYLQEMYQGRQRSRSLVNNVYKSKWYKQIKQNDPLETYKQQEQEKKQQMQILKMKLDNKKKYSQYVKVNHKPESDEKSVFRYNKVDIKRFEQYQIKRMGLMNLSYCKERISSERLKGNLTHRAKPLTQIQTKQKTKYPDYLQTLRKNRQSQERNHQIQQDFDQLISRIKNNPNLSKQQKIQKISSLAEKIQNKAKQRQQRMILKTTKTNGISSSRLNPTNNNQIDDTNANHKSTRHSLPSITVDMKRRSFSQDKLMSVKQVQQFVRNDKKNGKKGKGITKNDQFLDMIDKKLKLLERI